jgi:hypothetical protein
MGDWLLNLPVWGMACVILGVVWLGAAAIHLAVGKLATGERARAFKAISPGILPPLAIIFALLVGFLAAQVWNESDRAGTAVNREASALRAVVLLAAAFPGETEGRVRTLVRDYIEEAAATEWPAMAARQASLAIAPPKLADALALSLSLTPQRDGQVVAQREMAVALQGALDARRQRIILSRSSINWVKWLVLIAQAGLTLLTIAMVHADNRAASRIILGVFATGVGLAFLLIAAHSRPFTGEVSVRPAVLLQVMPEAGGVDGAMR